MFLFICIGARAAEGVDSPRPCLAVGHGVQDLNVGLVGFRFGEVHKEGIWTITVVELCLVSKVTQRKDPKPLLLLALRKNGYVLACVSLDVIQDWALTRNAVTRCFQRHGVCGTF